MGRVKDTAPSSRTFSIESPLAIELRRIMIRLGRNLDLETRRCLMVTSSQRGEGKSLFASHFALVLAHHLRKRVLLVDGDLRRPVQHVVFQVRQTPGLAELLRGRPAAPQRTARSNLDVLPAGEGRDNAAEILSGADFKATVEGWKRDYELVVLDSPPVVPVSDPLQYVEAVDGVIFLLLAGRTPRDVAERGVEILRGVGANIVGVVANNLSEVLPYHYDRKYYGYASRKAPLEARVTPSRGASAAGLKVAAAKPERAAPAEPERAPGAPEKTPPDRPQASAPTKPEPGRGARPPESGSD